MGWVTRSKVRTGSRMRDLLGQQIGWMVTMGLSGFNTICQSQWAALRSPRPLDLSFWVLWNWAKKRGGCKKSLEAYYAFLY